ncbi:MAG TPA: SDR family NAD(P)-dependent oxidoreductase [Spirochaetia bacterium]|nr:SDR family NAD(P)-dependent oxidoreductase [Spirochaetia bacterium]
MSDSTYSRIVVTGASGFIGGHLAEALFKRGYHVRAVYRRANPPEGLARLACDRFELFQADLAQEERLAQMVAGMDAVIHVAARASDWGPYADYERDNYTATVRLLEAARNAGCRKMVVTSSIAVHGFGPHVDTTEEGPYYRHIAPYQITKKMAEDYALSQDGKGIAVTAIRPGNVLGPGDTTVTFPILDGMERGLMGYISGGRSLTCPVYVGDLVNAHILALETPAANGLVFNITGGERVTWREYIEEAARCLGMRAPRKSVPGPLAYGLAALLEAVYHAVSAKKAPLLTRYRVAQLMYDFHFAVHRAETVLGYRPQTTWRDALRLTVEDYRRLTGTQGK